MASKKRIVCVIPARLASQRFPRKVLSSLCGQPLLKWVWAAATKIHCFDDVVFAVDSLEAADLITSFGGRYIMTSLDHATGTDRLIEVVKKGWMKGDLWVNWQADEPFISQQMIHDLLQGWEKASIDVLTLKKRILQESDISSSNTVKVVCRRDGSALYFSRSPIPHYREAVVGQKKYYKHVGIYAYKTDALLQIGSMKQGFLESCERLEQLRFLEYGLTIGVNETNQEMLDINAPEDLERAEFFIKQHNLQVPEV